MCFNKKNIIMPEESDNTEVFTKENILNSSDEGWSDDNLWARRRKKKSRIRSGLRTKIK